jgi:hypothetical protein
MHQLQLPLQLIQIPPPQLLLMIQLLVAGQLELGREEQGQGGRWSRAGGGFTKGASRAGRSGGGAAKAAWRCGCLDWGLATGICSIVTLVG